MGIANGLACSLADASHGRAKFVSKVSRGRDDQTDAERERSLTHVKSRGQIFQRNRCIRAGFEPVQQRARERDPARAVVCAEQDRFRFPVDQVTIGDSVGRRGVFFKDCVGVHTSESERIHARAPRVSCFAVDPRSRFGHKRQPIGSLLKECVGLIRMWRGWNHPMMQRECRLDQRGNPRRRHGVADQRRKGAECASIALRRRKNRQQGAQLRAIGGRNAQAVPFDVADARWINARAAIGASKRPRVALRARRGEARAAAIAGQADPFHDRIDPIAVAFRVGETLQDNDAHPFARQCAVGIAREGPRTTAPRERSQTRENHREIDIWL